MELQLVHKLTYLELELAAKTDRAIILFLIEVILFVDGTKSGYTLVPVMKTPAM